MTGAIPGVEAALSYIDLSCDRLGKRLGVTGEAVRLWRRGKQRMSGRHAEQLDGMFGVPRHLLRPDLFDPPPESAAAVADLPGAALR